MGKNLKEGRFASRFLLVIPLPYKTMFSASGGGSGIFPAGIKGKKNIVIPLWK
jgi:hypothetical protein